MRRILLFVIGIFLISCVNAQSIKGVIKDKDSGETLIGANIIVTGTSMGTVTDLDGNYELSLSPGDYELTISYVGYTAIIDKVTISNKALVRNYELISELSLNEVMVVADVARSRETPVAFSTITPQKLEEIIAAQDIPMVLNSTPGVYATTEGGGDGDAQVSIRGFSARNVGVLLDGVPVNDMENGHVYWSNWFGLDAVTRSIQVQRGLGASKLALPSVGGTINIITKGLDSRKEYTLKQEVGSDGYARTSFGLSTGLLKNNWSITAAGSYKRGNGWVEQTWTKGFFYYFKVDKKLGKHNLSASVYGAPQSHGQRSYMLPIQYYDSDLARELGVPEEDIEKVTPQGVRFNQHWGYLARTRNNPDAEPEGFAERVNEYHKPQFTLKDSWTVNDKLFISNIAYLSIGNGGGVRAKKTPPTNDETGRMDFQLMYDGNYGENAINRRYDSELFQSRKYMRRLVNSHRWLGFLSTINYKPNRKNSISGGIDLRTYRGIHYEEVYDLLGGDYALFDYVYGLTQENASQFMLKEGDINNYHNDGYVRWGGLFAQWEYKNDKLSSFLNLTTANTGYQRADYMIMRSTKDAVERDGFTYKNVDGNKVEVTSWNWFPGFTAKGGANYNFTSSLNAFANIGYLSKAPRFSNVYDYDNQKFQDIKNEKIKAVEFGASYLSTSFTANINAYYTLWENKPFDSTPSIEVDGENYQVNINGMNAMHKGIELDFVYKITHKLEFQGLMSLGDWRWNTADSLRIYDDNNVLKEVRFFDAKGVHVGNSAQTQFAGEIRWEPINKWYIKPRVTYFADYYANFDPISLNGKPKSYEWYDEATGEHGDPRDSWKIPSYMVFDFHTGYNFRMWGQYFKFRFNVLNVLDKAQIIRAQNNDPYNGQLYDEFDAKSASVFFGLGRRYSASLQIVF